MRALALAAVTFLLLAAPADATPIWVQTIYAGNLIVGTFAPFTVPFEGSETTIPAPPPVDPSLWEIESALVWIAASGGIQAVFLPGTPVVSNGWATISIVVEDGTGTTVAETGRLLDFYCVSPSSGYPEGTTVCGDGNSIVEIETYSDLYSLPWDGGPLTIVGAWTLSFDPLLADAVEILLNDPGVEITLTYRPVPEPKPAMLVAIGLGLVAWQVRSARPRAKQ